MPSRIIRDGFLDSPRVNTLDWFAECVYHRALLAADHAGRLDGRPAVLRHRLFPVRDEVTTEEVAAAVERIISAGLAIRWTAPNGQAVIQLTNWHRDGNASTARYPGPDGRFEIQYVRLPAPTQSGWIDVVATSVPGQSTDQSVTQPTNCGGNSPLERGDRIPKPSHADGMGMGSASHPDGIGIPSACHAHPMPMGSLDDMTDKRINGISSNDISGNEINSCAVFPTTCDEHVAGTPAAQPDEVVFVYPTDGPRKTWALTRSRLERLQQLYPSLDVMSECRRALAWLEANPTNRKTASGMPRFLVNWLNRECNRGRDRPSAERSPPTDWRQDYERRWLARRRQNGNGSLNHDAG